jgi:hypothetical protein
MRTLIVSTVLLLALATGGLWYMERMENPRSSFATFEEMEAAGLVARGWLPEFLPHSATDINETHDIDTNRVRASFKYDVADVQSVEKSCERVSHDERGSSYLCRSVPAGSASLFLGRDGTAYYYSSPADGA